MTTYSIKDVEAKSGIKAHTIRAWEKRYCILEPRRTATNIRYYTEEDLQKITDIAFLREKGMKISKIAQLSLTEIQDLMSKYSESKPHHDERLENLINGALELNDYKLHSILDENIQEVGLENTVNELIFPFLDRVVMMWMTGTMGIVHEKFATNIITRKMLKSIDSIITPPKLDSTKILLYQVAEEHSQISTLYLHYLLIKDGHHVINIGNATITDLKEVLSHFDADIIFTIFNEAYQHKPLEPYIDQVSRMIGSKKLCITGYNVINKKLKSLDNIYIIENIHKIRAFCNQSL